MSLHTWWHHPVEMKVVIFDCLSSPGRCSNRNVMRETTLQTSLLLLKVSKRAVGKSDSEYIKFGLVIAGSDDKLRMWWNSDANVFFFCHGTFLFSSFAWEDEEMGLKMQKVEEPQAIITFPIRINWQNKLALHEHNFLETVLIPALCTPTSPALPAPTLNFWIVCTCICFAFFNTSR